MGPALHIQAHCRWLATRLCSSQNRRCLRDSVQVPFSRPPRALRGVGSKAQKSRRRGCPASLPARQGPVCAPSASEGRQNTLQLLSRQSESIRTQSTTLGLLLIKCLHLNYFPPEGNTLTREKAACAGRAGPIFCWQLLVPVRRPRPQPAPAPCLGSRATGHAPHTHPAPPSCSGAWENADAPWPG